MGLPEDLEKKGIDFYQISTGEKVIEGPIESMSKSKKNVIDPQSIIDSYGADSARWFMLSDSPPEKTLTGQSQHKWSLEDMPKNMVPGKLK